MISRAQLNFHDTFQPDVTYLGKILDLASQNYSGTKEEISGITGIPTGKRKGKVEPHIRYCMFMGLIQASSTNGVYELSLTDLGREIYTQDRFLHEILTRWICHYEISRREVGAPQWSYIVHEGHSGLYQCNSSDYHLAKANELLGTNVSFNEIFGIPLRCYMDGFLEDINYLKWDDSVNGGEKDKSIKYVEHFNNPELLYVYAYAIWNSWGQLFPEKSEITLTELTESIELGKIFNLSNEDIDSILGDLEMEGILKLNRQLYPLTMIRTVSINHIISQLYSRLL